jgi:hypothetical protein
MATPPSKMIDRVTRQHRKWISETAQSVFDRSSTWLDADLAEGSLHSVRNISDSLHGLATYYGIRGAVDVMDGVVAPWANVHRSCHYHLWSIRLDDLAFRRVADSSTLTLIVPKVACSLCYTIACDFDQWSRTQTTLLSEMASGSGIADEPFWKERHFEPFILRLRQVMENKEQRTLNEEEDFGVYNGVLTHWNDEVALGEALVRICDYHCENMDDDDGDWKPEFGEAPFDLIPWELLAIGRIRHLAGLVMPTISHPLTKPMVMQFEKSVQIQDETLTRVETFYRHVAAP